MKNLYGDNNQHSRTNLMKYNDIPAKLNGKIPPKKVSKTKIIPKRKLNFLTERQHQIRVVTWAKKMGFDIVSHPNEGERSIRNGAILKMMGLSPGFPDLHIPEARGGYFGCYIEMKQDRKYSEYERNTSHWLSQEEWINKLKNKGYYASFAFGYEEGIKILESYYNLKPTKVNLSG
jgi:hypothetical protein